MLLILVTLALAATIRTLLLIWHTIENRRFARSRMRSPVPRVELRPVSVVVPCKGVDLQLERNLRAVLQQDHPCYEVKFVVDCDRDPACEVIRRVIADMGNGRAELLVAGPATNCSQKIHNLRYAVARVTSRTHVLAFVDSDAQIRSTDWLRRLTARLNEPGVGAVTAYRWMVPVAKGLPNAILCSINASVAWLLGPGPFNVVWGGGWAIRRDLFEAIGVDRRWRSGLSDDLIATCQLKRHGWRIDFEPGCMVHSPIDHSWSSLLEFLRRQYVIGRIYTWPLWSAAFVSSSVGVLGFWGAAAATTIAAVGGSAWAGVFAASLGGLYVLQAIHAAVRQNAGRLYADAGRQAAWVDVLGAPFVATFNWLVMASALFGRRIRWRGITYRLRSDGTIDSISRPADFPEARQPFPRLAPPTRKKAA